MVVFLAGSEEVKFEDKCIEGVEESCCFVLYLMAGGYESNGHVLSLCGRVVGSDGNDDWNFVGECQFVDAVA